MDRRKILITTKTYPSISTRYKETVCTAGVLLDDNEKPIQWIRIYPIRFRGLDSDQRYPRYSIISANIERNHKDYREESYRIEDNSIEIVRKLTTKNAWSDIKDLILPLESKSLKAIQDQGKSLGIIKPASIERFFYKETEREWTDKQQAIQDQMDLLEPSIELEKIPYRFGYDFVDRDGIKHSYSISDWEISQLYRNCRDRSEAIDPKDKEIESVGKVRKKLETFMEKNDLYFMIGNLKVNKNTFTIIGLFYPPMIQSEQLKLVF